jgi:hypothetical protein
MKAVKTIAIGAAGLAVLVGGAAPAAAQYYPGYGSGYSQYGYAPNVIGQVLQSILNPYGQFGYRAGVHPQVAVQQCTAAVQQRLQMRYRAGYNPYGAYGQYGGYGGYSPYGYNNAYSQARVLGITRVDQRSATTLRVRGVATSGMMYANPYGAYGGYGGGYGGYGGYGYAQAQAPADLSFRCDVDYRGYIRDIDIDRRRY